MIMIILYVFGIFTSYKMIQKQHSKGGEYQLLPTGVEDFIMVFTPFINLMFPIFYIIENLISSKKNFNNFFGVKK